MYRRIQAALICVLLILMTSLPARADGKILDPALMACVQKSLTRQGIASMSDITQLKCNNRGVKSIEGIFSLTKLEILSLFNNDIETVNLTGLTHLKTLNLASNRLSTLSLADLPELKKVYVFKNQLKNLSLSNLPALQLMKANNNQLESIRFKSVSMLTKLYLFNNELGELDMQTLPALSYLDARQNPMPDEFYDELDTIASLTALHDGNQDDWQ